MKLYPPEKAERIPDVLFAHSVPATSCKVTQLHPCVSDIFCNNLEAIYYQRASQVHILKGELKDNLTFISQETIQYSVSYGESALNFVRRLDPLSSRCSW